MQRIYTVCLEINNALKRENNFNGYSCATKNMYMVDCDKFMYQIYLDEHAFVDVHCDCDIRVISSFKKIRIQYPAFRCIVANDKPKMLQCWNVHFLFYKSMMTSYALRWSSLNTRLSFLTRVQSSSWFWSSCLFMKQIPLWQFQLIHDKGIGRIFAK